MSTFDTPGAAHAACSACSHSSQETRLARDRLRRIAQEKYLTAKVEMGRLFSPMTPFIIVMFATIVLLAYFPWLFACDPEGHRRLHNGAPHLIPCIWHGLASR